MARILTYHLIRSTDKLEKMLRRRRSERGFAPFYASLRFGTTMAEYPDRICPHLHVSLQSGSNRVLRRMRRRWGAERFVDRCRLVGESLPAAAFTRLPVPAA